MNRHIAVLGCGPAGLLAAWAGALTGCAVSIFSERAEPSVLGGAQFLHMRIPGVTDERPDAIVENIYRGDAETYRTKVYGDRPVPFVSFGGSNETRAWNLKDVYEKLWDRMSGPRLNIQKVTGQWLKENVGEFDQVFSSVPLRAICLNPAHQFQVQPIYISTRPDVHDPLTSNTILWDGTRKRSWYRCSLLFGHHGTEWSNLLKPPYPDLISDRKPIATSCDCWADQETVHLVGRRGTWRKGVLTHHAFIEAAKVLL